MISKLQPLSESMHYILLTLYTKDSFGIEISDYVNQITHGRIKLGPGTLYTIISKFESEKIITEISVEGRKRTYRITDYGRLLFEDEVKRLKYMLRDSETTIPGGSHD